MASHGYGVDLKDKPLSCGACHMSINWLEPGDLGGKPHWYINLESTWVWFPFFLDKP